MDIMRRAVGALAAAGIGIAGLAGAAQAQTEYPTRSINWIIPFSPGSGADLFARNLINVVQDVLGVPVVPVNRDGGGSSIGTAFAMNQPADGYTLLSNSDTLALGLASGEWPVTVDQIQGVARVNADFKTIVVPANSPFQTFEDLVEHARNNNIRIGGVGARSWSSVFAARVMEGAGFTATYIPYDGGSQVVSAVVGENIEAGVVTSSNVNAQVDSGDLRMLAHSLAERSAERPDVPTLAELGLEELADDLLWRAVFAPIGTPEHVLDILSAAIEEAIQDERWRTYMENQRQVDAFMPHAEFTQNLRDLVAEYERTLN